MKEPAWKNRIVGQGVEAPDQLMANPRNWRNHPKHQQDALEGALAEVGWVQNVIVNQRTGHLVDGHLRVELAMKRGAKEVPVVYVDLSEDEELMVLATIDPLSAMATTDQNMLDGIIGDLEPENKALQELLDSLATPDGEQTRAEQAAAKGRLANLFLVPPFSVLDGRGGMWQDRKGDWLSLGIKSEVGRGNDGDKGKKGLTYAISCQPPEVLTRKREIEARTGQTMSWAEFAEKHPEEVRMAGTSIFDPVLCEVAYRWFCPEGGSILDPFAGGSVRGIVAAMLGYAYTGIDLREEQIVANRRNWLEVIGRGGLTKQSGTIPALKVEEHDGIRVVRDDRVPGGTKRRALVRVMREHPAQEFVYATPAYGFAQMALAYAAADVGKKATVFVAKRGTLHPRTVAAKAAGANVIEVDHGYLSNVTSKAKAYAEEHGAHYVEFGVEDQAALEALADIAIETGENPTEVWTVAGSGVLTRALQRAWPTATFHAVQIGADPNVGKATLHKAPEKFENPAKHPPPFPSCPEYDAKAWRFIQKHASPGALFWNVGSDLHGGDEEIDTVSPRWIAADSRTLEEHVSDEVDLVFSCPPYADLEVYSDDPADISNMDYEEFLEAYRDIIAKACGRLRNNRFAVFVVGDLRGKNGAYRNFVGDTIQAFQDAGLAYYNEAVLINSIASVAMRAANSFTTSRKLGKCHQNVLVFSKGAPEKLTVENVAQALGQAFEQDRRFIDQMNKVLVFSKGDPREAAEELGMPMTADPLEELVGESES